ncbi:MAG TPA: hypothetical protein ENH82_13860 [bacterium]|nr:hypothetical protein [bacterium]
MAGVAVLAVSLKVTGIGDDVLMANSQTLTVPVESQSGYTVITTATTTGIQLFDFITAIALNKIYGAYIKAVSGTILIAVDTAGTGTLTTSTADLILYEGEATYLPINAGGNLGLVVDGVAVTDSLQWVILGKV